jgi:hypothetical protein
VSELPSHGTGFLESEAFIDVVALFGAWSDNGQAPDFTVVERRLHEQFNLSELRNLEVAARTLATLIDRELALRGSDPDY